MAKGFKHFAFIFTLLLTFLYVPNVFAELTIGNYSLQSKERISRYEYSYTYKADITNTSDTVKNAAAIVSSVSVKTKVIENSLSFGDVGAGDTITSSDNFTIIHDRRIPFDPNNLSWEITADPSIDGNAALEGIDSDNDGVRDDVQTFITERYPSNINSKLALRQLANAYQEALIAVSNNNQEDVNISLGKISSATQCILFTTKNIEDTRLIESKMMNTIERVRAYEEVNALASGQFFGINLDLESTCIR